jgi:hypothetical protein
MILYVSAKCATAERMGLTKLNKIIWKADFDSFAERDFPVTGRKYQKLERGPAALEMRPLLNEMEAAGLLAFEIARFSDGKEERRPIAQQPASLDNFSPIDLQFVKRSIQYYWYKSGTESGDDSHGIAWKGRKLKSIMHYELSYLSDDRITEEERISFLQFVNETQ